MSQPAATTGASTLKPFPALSWRANAGWFTLGAAVLAPLSAIYKHLDVVLSGGTRPFAYPLLEEMTGALGAVLLAPLVIGASRRWPLLGPRGWRWLPAHLAGMLAFAVLSTTWMWASRSLLAPLLGLGHYDYGAMPLRYFMELPKEAIVFSLILVMTTLFDRHEAARERELRFSRIEASLARAELGALHAQLRPHFLFNALNAISSVMYEDAERADRMIRLLSDLLRWSLRASSAAEVELAAELGATRTYLELMQARMGPRLHTEIRVEPGTERALVPALLLQPLVENAATHGTLEPPEQARIVVQVMRDGADLVLRVCDNGPGPAAPSGTGNGVGLSNTKARLSAMYGPAAQLRLLRGDTGGAIAEVRLPFRTSAAFAAEQKAVWTSSV